jgi:hypothetical protein
MFECRLSSLSSLPASAIPFLKAASGGGRGERNLLVMTARAATTSPGRRKQPDTVPLMESSCSKVEIVTTRRPSIVTKNYVQQVHMLCHVSLESWCIVCSANYSKSASQAMRGNTYTTRPDGSPMAHRAMFATSVSFGSQSTSEILDVWCTKGSTGAAGCASNSVAIRTG